MFAGAVDGQIARLSIQVSRKPRANVSKTGFMLYSKNVHLMERVLRKGDTSSPQASRTDEGEMQVQRKHEVFTNVLNELTTTFPNWRETTGC